MADHQDSADFRYEARHRLAAAVGLLDHVERGRIDPRVALVGCRSLVATSDLWLERAAT